MNLDFLGHQPDIDSIEERPIALTRQYICVFLFGYLVSATLEIVATGKMFHPLFSLVVWAGSGALFLGIFCLVTSITNRWLGWLAVIATGLFVILGTHMELLNLAE
jgi:hypothetical protein